MSTQRQMQNVLWIFGLFSAAKKLQLCSASFSRYFSFGITFFLLFRGWRKPECDPPSIRASSADKPRHLSVQTQARSSKQATLMMLIWLAEKMRRLLQAMITKIGWTAHELDHSSHYHSSHYTSRKWLRAAIDVECEQESHTEVWLGGDAERWRRQFPIIIIHAHKEFVPGPKIACFRAQNVH